MYKCWTILLVMRVRYNYEDHRSKTYQETTSGVEVHGALQPQAIHAKKKLTKLMGCPQRR